MPTFTITREDGIVETLAADECRAEHPWLVFSTGGREIVRIQTDTIRTVVTQSGPPAGSAALRHASALVLTVAGAACLVLGGADVLVAATTSPRILGAGLVVAGWLCLAGAHAAWSAGHEWLRSAIRATIATFSAAVALLLVQRAGEGRPDALTVVLAGAVAASAVVGWLLWREGARPRAPTVLRGVFTAGIVAALFQFWYVQEHVPSSRDAGLTELVTLEATPAADATTPRYLTGVVTLENVSGGNVRVIGARYSFWAVDVDGEAGEARPPILLRQGALGLGVGNWLSPDQEHSERVVMALPEGQRGTLRFQVELHVTKGDRLERATWAGREDGGCAMPAWKVDESSLVYDLTREDRYVVHERGWIDPACAPDGPPPRLCVSRRPDRCPAPGTSRLGSVYGHVTVTADTLLALA